MVDFKNIFSEQPLLPPIPPTFPQFKNSTTYCVKCKLKTQIVDGSDTKQTNVTSCICWMLTDLFYVFTNVYNICR